MRGLHVCCCYDQSKFFLLILVVADKYLEVQWNPVLRIPANNE